MKWRLTSELMVQLLAGQSSVASVMMTGLACRDGTIMRTLNQYLGYQDPAPNPGFLVTNYEKILLYKNLNIFLRGPPWRISKFQCQFFKPWNYFYIPFLKVIFIFALDPDPDSEYEPKSTEPTETGSATLPWIIPTTLPKGKRALRFEHFNKAQPK